MQTDYVIDQFFTEEQFKPPENNSGNILKKVGDLYYNFTNWQELKDRSNAYFAQLYDDFFSSGR